MSRGGSRQGKPGVAYSNRSDLQAVKAAPGQEYGVAGAQREAQRAVPLPDSSHLPAGVGGGATATSGAVAPPASFGMFDRPTERPGEPVQTGIPEGPGMGPEALSTVGPAVDTVGQRLRALYQLTPNNDLLRLIELHDNGF